MNPIIAIFDRIVVYMHINVVIIFANLLIANVGITCNSQLIDTRN